MNTGSSWSASKAQPAAATPVTDKAANAMAPTDTQEALVPVGKKKQKRAQKEAELASAPGEEGEDDGKGKRGKKK